MYNFRSLSNRFPTISIWRLISHFTPQVRLFFVEKRKPKSFGLKNATKRGIRKCLTFLLRQIAGSKMFGKIILKPLQIRKDSSSPRMTEQIQIFIVPLRMHFYSTLDSLKSDFNVFTMVGNRRWVPLTLPTYSFRFRALNRIIIRLKTPKVLDFAELLFQL